MAITEVSVEQQGLPDAQRIENENLGVLGGAGYQIDNDRIKGFCGRLVDHPDDYGDHLALFVLPLKEEFRPTRIIDRALVREGVDINEALRGTNLRVEATIRLGERWEGYSWMMLGENSPGRSLSSTTTDSMKDLAYQASQQPFVPTRSLPEGYSLEPISNMILPEADINRLVEVFKQSFDDYITPMDDPNFVRAWIVDPSTLPIVIRNSIGQIVSVASGELGEIKFGDLSFKFMEIGDSASDLEYRRKSGLNLGLNRIIKHRLLTDAKQRGFDSVHTETRACWGSPNFGNARNGMDYRGLLMSNCVIRGPDDISESSDPNLADWAKRYGSLNVWALTPAYYNWGMF